MDLQMSFKQMDASDAIKFYTQEKCETLTKYFQGRISVEWIFSVEKDVHIAHCHLMGNNMNYFAQAETQEMHASVDMAIDKIERQIRKHKEVVKDHLHRNGHRTPLPAASGE